MNYRTRFIYLLLILIIGLTFASVGAYDEYTKAYPYHTAKVMLSGSLVSFLLSLIYSLPLVIITKYFAKMAWWLRGGCIGLILAIVISVTVNLIRSINAFGVRDTWVVWCPGYIGGHGCIIPAFIINQFSNFFLFSNFYILITGALIGLVIGFLIGKIKNN